MREELKRYADEAFGIVETASEDIGSRLPGSEGEKRFARYMAGKLEAIGIKPVKEEFLVAPRASIGGIPYIGWIGIICAVALCFEQLYFLVALVTAATWVWTVLAVFLYKPWFDFAFHQEVSQNVYGELLPEDGKYDYTIILSAHTDTSWNWKHSAIRPVTAFVKMGIGIVAFLTLTAVGLALFIMQCILQFSGPVENLAQAVYYSELAESYANLAFAAKILTVFFIPGCFFITMWADKNGRTASPGAMDNATGVGIAYAATKYFRENPDKHPAGCRIIDFNCGSEEAGLRGSMAFTKKHKGEDILKNVWNINIDSVADKDHFEVVHGDAWQFTRFDRDLEVMFLEAMKEAGIEKPGNIINPVGGCDSTPMTKAGVRSITFAAQNPDLTYYYHTFYDRMDRFDVDTVHLGLDVVLRVIDKIARKEAGALNVAAEAPADEQLKQSEK